MTTKVESVEVLNIGPGDADVAIAVFVSHHFNAPALDVHTAQLEARDMVYHSYYEDFREDVINATEQQATRLLSTNLGDNRWMTTTVFGPTKETCVDILRKMFPAE